MRLTTIYDCLRDCLSRFRLPVVLLSDNDLQLTSYGFQKFMLKIGLKRKLVHHLSNEVKAKLNVMCTL